LQGGVNTTTVTSDPDPQLQAETPQFDYSSPTQPLQGEVNTTTVTSDPDPQLQAGVPQSDNTPASQPLQGEVNTTEFNPDSPPELQPETPQYDRSTPTGGTPLQGGVRQTTLVGGVKQTTLTGGVNVNHAVPGPVLKAETPKYDYSTPRPQTPNTGAPAPKPKSEPRLLQGSVTGGDVLLMLPEKPKEGGEPSDGETKRPPHLIEASTPFSPTDAQDQGYSGFLQGFADETKKLANDDRKDYLKPTMKPDQVSDMFKFVGEVMDEDKIGEGAEKVLKPLDYATKFKEASEEMKTYTDWLNTYDEKVANNELPDSPIVRAYVNGRLAALATHSYLTLPGDVMKAIPK
jgi:hypothetical protein